MLRVSRFGKLLCCRRRAVGKQHPTGVLHLDGSNLSICAKKKRDTFVSRFFFLVGV